MRQVRTRGLLALVLVALVAGLVAGPATAKPKTERQNGRWADSTEESVTLGSVTRLDTVTPNSGSSLDTTATAEDDAAPASDPVAELGSLYNVIDQVGARMLWEAGITGAGVDVAVIDTGIAPVPAMSAPDKISAAVDLSFEAHVPEAVYLDTYGHGTHMAGIIAGRQPGAEPTTATPEQFLGVAPDAHIVSVKVADNTGAVDVSQVIAGIDWVIQHRNTGDLNIRVINLSYGTDSLQARELDPLSKAVENAWEHGIVVVVAAGNDGWKGNDGLAMPARNRHVIAVGAAEATDWGFTIPDWASPGEYLTGQGRESRHYWQDGYTGRIPDVLAPGAHIDSLRVPASRVDSEHPEGYVNETLFRGSGSSQAAAVVSGAVALLLQQRPELSPDQVKALLAEGAESIANWGEVFQGHGVIDVAVSAALPTPDATQRWERATGLGSLEASRGTQHVTLDGVLLAGEITAWGAVWDPTAWLQALAAGTSWTDPTWTDADWAGNSWTGNSWTGNSWTDADWAGNSWTGNSWTGNSWTGNSWTGNSWTGNSWTGNSWTGAGWG